MAYISDWNIMDWSPKTEGVLPTAHSVHTSTNAFTGLGPVCIPDQVTFVVWAEPVLPVTPVKELDY